MSNGRVREELLSADESVGPGSGPVAGPSASSKTDVKEGSKKVLTAAQIRLKERTQRLVAKKNTHFNSKKEQIWREKQSFEQDSVLILEKQR